MSCKRATCSYCLARPKVSAWARWRQWPAAYRWWPQTWAVFPRWCSTARPVFWPRWETWRRWRNGCAGCSATGIFTPGCRGPRATAPRRSSNSNRPWRATRRPIVESSAALQLLLPLAQRLLDVGFEEEVLGLLAKLVGLFGQRVRILVVALGREQRGLDPEIEPIFFEGQRLVDVLQAGGVVFLVIQHVARSKGEGSPGAVDAGGNVGQGLLGGVDLDGDGQEQTLPFQIERGLVVGEIREDKRHALAEGSRLGLHLHAQEIQVGLVLAPRASLVGLLVEHHGPRALGGDGEQGVAARRHGLAGKDHVLAEADLGGLIGAGSPHLIERHQAAPDPAPLDRRAAVLDRHLGQAHHLRDLGRRTGTRQLGLGHGQRG